MGGKSSRKAVVGYRYYMTLIQGLCRGPIDELVQIDVGSVRAWPIPDGEQGGRKFVATSGLLGIIALALTDRLTKERLTPDHINTATSTGSYEIRAPNLFGGDKKEGGIDGTLRVQMGANGQVVPAWIKSLIGGRVPDYRGVVTLVFNGLICSLNPYPKPWTFRVRRTVSGWDGNVWEPQLATIWMDEGSIKAMNGAHILFEILTNRLWGRGLARSQIDLVSWKKAAQTLFNEGFGLCLLWTRQTDLSEFTQTVLDHIGGSIYPDRVSGKLCLGLLRGDYDAARVPLFTYSTGLLEVSSLESSVQEDITNEVIVKWTDPHTSNSERQARVQNIASRQSIDSVNSVSTDYVGLTTEELALRVAQRDLKASTNAHKKFKVVLDRRAWRITPSSVFRISVPQRGIQNLVLRAGTVREADDGDGRIEVEGVIDVFGMPSASYTSPPENNWMPPSREAVVAERRLVREATYVELVRALTPSELSGFDQNEGAVISLVAKPTTLSQGYYLHAQAEGEAEAIEHAALFAPYVILAEQLDPGQTVVSFSGGGDIGLMSVGDVVQIGEEICRLDDIDLDESGLEGHLTLGRGCADTIPMTHEAGETAFVYSEEIGVNEREYARGETVSVKVLPYTSTSRLSDTLAPADEVLIEGRHARPYPPGNLKINDVAFYDHDVHTATGDVALSWSHRNRLLQEDQLVDHTAPSVTLEAGVSYTVKVFPADSDTAARTVTGLTGETWTYTAAMRAADLIVGDVDFVIAAVRSGRQSIFNYRVRVTFD